MSSMTPKQRLFLERLHREFEWKFPSRPNDVREFIVNNPAIYDKAKDRLERLLLNGDVRQASSVIGWTKYSAVKTIKELSVMR
jgi:hypothetical protein